MTTDLQKLFRPKSIAVIGGGSWCANVINQSRAFGFTGPIWPVHPNKPEIAGEKSYPTVQALPAVPDASFIGINRLATIEAVAALSAIIAGGAVCFASGFQEAAAEDKSSSDLQQQLLKAAGQMPILGPNCYGFINYLDGTLLWPDQHGGRKTDTGVAIITQSSNIAINITMQHRGLPIGMIVTAGNQAQTGLAEIGEHLLQDPRITALGLHIEGIGELAAMENLAQQAHALNKPVIALKVGSSTQAQAATISHTASLAGSGAGARALLKRLAIPQVDTLPQFLEALKLLHVTGPLKSNRIASLSCSGGEASLMADLAQPNGVTFPPLTAPQKTDLRTALGPMVNLANPLDYHTYIWNDADKMADAFSAMMDPGLALGIVVSDFPRADRCEPADWDCIITSVSQTARQRNIPMAIAASLPENIPENVADRLIQQGITPLCGLPEALTAARVAAQCNTAPNATPILPPRPPKNPINLTEAQSKAALATHGLNIPRSALATCAAHLPQLAASLKPPFALKGQGVAHKTEAGAVALNLTTPDQIIRAAKSMPTSTYLLEEMVTGTVAELLIGVVLDPAHGYVLTIGAGGTLTEILQDTASLMIPASRQDIETALSTLKIHQILSGYRGQPAANIPAILDATLAIQAYVIANHGTIAEVEVNPLLCLPDAAIAADALIRTGDTND
ncbi:MAG: acetate--CoA ligase family protein [Paracoccaceae bacterium]